MNSKIPRTLIQIHYHDHPGGVTRVMGEYARTFAAPGPVTARNIIVCSHPDAAAWSKCQAQPIDLPGLAYRRYRTKASFSSARNTLATKLTAVIADPAISRPIIVIGHNVTLGKNLALTAAFADCARALGSSDIRFYPMVHDMAEEGRNDLLQDINDLEKKGVPIRRVMYRRIPHLAYVTLNARAHRALSRAGLPVRRMINLVTADRPVVPTGAVKRKLERALCRLSRLDGTSFDPSRPTVFYPSRVVPRKNTAEAILITCIINGYNLITGAPGQSPADRLMYKKLLAFSKKHNLPVIFGFDRLTPSFNRPILPLLYAYSRFCISTSILEGFGFGLYEPWLYNRAVYGRLPSGFTNPPGFDTRTFYTTISVPAGPDQRTDFGLLGLNEQLAVLRQLISHPEQVDFIRALHGKSFSKRNLHGLVVQNIQKNAHAVQKAFGTGSFTAAFEHCFLSGISHKPGIIRIPRIINSL